MRKYLILFWLVFFTTFLFPLPTYSQRIGPINFTTPPATPPPFKLTPPGQVILETPPSVATQEEIKQETEVIVNGYPDGMPQQPPSYSAGVYLLTIFDKKSQAHVATRIIFDQEDKESLRDLKILIPGKDITLSQAVHEKLRLKRVCPPVKYSPPIRPLPDEDTTYEKSSVIYPPYDSCYPNYVSLFTTVNVDQEQTKDGLLLKLKAEPDLSAKSQESLLFSFWTPSFTRKLLTNYNYKLATPRLPIYSSTVQVGIIVKSGLYLKGGPPYSWGETFIPSFKALEKKKTFRQEENQELQDLASQIVYQGTIRRTDSDLPPNDSFVVKGTYGTFFPLLYLKEAVWGLLFLLTAIVAIVCLFRLGKIGKNPNLKLIAISTIVSFVSSTLAVILLFVLYLFLRMRWVIPY